MAVVNFPPRQIGPVRSEVLTLGASDDEGRVILLAPTPTYRSARGSDEACSRAGERRRLGASTREAPGWCSGKGKARGSNRLRRGGRGRGGRGVAVCSGVDDGLAVGCGVGSDGTLARIGPDEVGVGFGYS